MGNKLIVRVKYTSIRYLLKYSHMLEKKHYKTLNRFISEKYLDETYLQKLKEDFYTQKYVKHLAFSDFLKKEFVA